MDSEQICAELAVYGLFGEYAERLAPSLLSPPAGTFTPQAFAAASGDSRAVLAAMAAAVQFREHHVALRTLLAWLEEREASLSWLDRGRLWHLIGFSAWRLDDALYTATAALNRSVEILHREPTDEARAYLARVLDTYGQIRHQQGLLADAMREFQLSLALRRDVGDEVGLAITLGNIGRLCMDQGAWSIGASHLAEDLALVERLYPERTALRTMLLSHLGTCALELGQLDEAAARFEASLALAQTHADLVGEAFALLGQGWLALRRPAVSSVATAQARGLAHAAIERIEQASAPLSFQAEIMARAYHLAAEALRVSGAAEAIGAYEQARRAMAATPGFSPVDQAAVLQGQARTLQAVGDTDGAAHALRGALRHLDATAAEGMRLRIESELRGQSPHAWMLHAAGRFVGQGQISFLLEEAGRSGFRGERKDVVVLFSDIRGFTTLSEQLSPELLITLLNDLLTHLTRCVEGAGGMVDKFIGDAIMAVFSLPHPAVDDAERAVVAALRMHDELRWFNRHSPSHLPALNIGIGAHAGPVVAGLVGSPQKRSFTVIGDVVNTASRLEGMTKYLGASIVVTEELASRFPRRERFLLRPLGRFQPKGRVGALDLFDVVGERDGSAFARRLDGEIADADAALDLFTRRQFAASERALRELASRAPGGQSYRFLADTAARLLAHPPADDWDGSIPMTEK